MNGLGALTWTAIHDCLSFYRREARVKLFIAVIVLVWLLCGLGGAYMLGDHHWKVVARGPISLVQGFSDNPVSYPGPG